MCVGLLLSITADAKSPAKIAPSYKLAGEFSADAILSSIPGAGILQSVHEPQSAHSPA
jgi:hypothetical protein